MAEDVNRGGDGDRMYEMEFPAPEVRPADDGLTLVVALQGYADAGHAVGGSAQHLLDALDHRTVVSFHNDELVDYRSRRPPVTMVRDEIAEMKELDLSLQVLRDDDGKMFLLLSGPEPDFRWEAFSDAVADLAERFDVRRTVSLYSAPMTVPHTRPLTVIAHGNDRSVLQRHRTWGHKVTVPGAASLRIELELNRRGRSTSGFTAQVPHYIAQSEYPLAVLRLLEAVQEVGDLNLPLRALQQDSDRLAAMLAEQVAESGEVAQIVRMLEHQHDEEEHRRSTLESSPLIGENGRIPSADELGAEFERFLSNQLDAPEESPRTPRGEWPDAPVGDGQDASPADERDDDDRSGSDASASGDAGAAREDGADDAEDSSPDGDRADDAGDAPAAGGHATSAADGTPDGPSHGSAGSGHGDDGAAGHADGDGSDGDHRRGRRGRRRPWFRF
ncbi:PAC2 family protein [Corynebacterium sp. 335C]